MVHLSWQDTEEHVLLYDFDQRNLMKDGSAVVLRDANQVGVLAGSGSEL